MRGQENSKEEQWRKTRASQIWRKYEFQKVQMLEKNSIWSCQQNLEVHSHAFDGGRAGSVVQNWANQGLVLFVPLEGGEYQR